VSTGCLCLPWNTPLIPRFYHEAMTHVAELFVGEATAVGAGEECPALDALPAGLVRLPGEASDGAVAEDAPPWRLLEERRLDPHRPAVGSYRRTTDFRVSPTDPDATPMRIGSVTMLGDHDHYVVDGGKGRVILAALVTPADVMENVPLRDLLWRVCFRRKLRPYQVTGDTTYGTVENIVALEDAGVRAFFPLPDFDTRTPFFGKSAFTYDAVRDAYRCPQGQVLARRKTKYTEEEVLYRADAAVCNVCLVKAGARRATTGASSTVPSTPTTSTKCAATTPRRPTRRPCGNGKSGSPPGGYPASLKRRTGTAFGGSGCGAWRTRISRDC
jgi:hypothetical protein